MAKNFARFPHCAVRSSGQQILASVRCGMSLVFISSMVLKSFVYLESSLRIAGREVDWFHGGITTKSESHGKLRPGPH